VMVDHPISRRKIKFCYPLHFHRCSSLHHAIFEIFRGRYICGPFSLSDHKSLRYYFTNSC
jgi:hypothetical protein